MRLLLFVSAPLRVATCDLWPDVWKCLERCINEWWACVQFWTQTFVSGPELPCLKWLFLHNKIKEVNTVAFFECSMHMCQTTVFLDNGYVQENDMSLTCFHIHVPHGPGLSVGAACLGKRNSNRFSFIHPAISAILRNVRNEFLFQWLGEGCLNFELIILIFCLYFHYLQNDNRQSLYDVFWST